MSRYFYAGFFLLCFHLSFHLTTCKPFYVLMAPNMLRAGNEERIVIQGHECETNRRTVEIRVRSFKDEQMYHTVTYLNDSNSFLATALINIPPHFLSADVNEKQYVIVEARLDQISLKKVILLSQDIGHIFIQTTKTIYTPNQNVDYRIFTTDKNLNPVAQRVTILLQNPEGITVTKDSRVIERGIYAFPMKIPELVTFGTWKLVAKFQDAPHKEFSTQFEVREYVLPTFSVELKTENKYFYYLDNELVVNIKANYLFGESVNGYAVAVFGLYKDFLKTIHGSYQRVEITDGEGTAILTRKQLLDAHDQKELLGVSIYVNVTVFSSEGDYVQVHKTNIKIVSSPYNIVFIRTPTYFTPGMPINAKVLVTNPDMTAAANVPVVGDDADTKGTTSDEGLAELSINRGKKYEDMYITVRTDDPNLKPEQQASVTMKVKAYKTLYRNFLHISATLENNAAVVSLHIESEDVKIKDRTKYFTLLVISRGKILQAKIQKRTTGESYTLVRIPLTPEMLPSFRIVAYYYLLHLDKILEIASDSIWLHRKRTCKSILQINPPKTIKTYEPEKKVELSLTGEQGSQVGLVVVDKAVFVLNNKEKFTQDKIWDKVQEDDLACTAGKGANALGVFEDAGLDFATTMQLETRSRKDYNCATDLHSRRRRSYELQAAKQKKASETPAHLRPCCLAGLHDSPMDLDCSTRKKHVQDKVCAETFFECCIHAEQLREQMTSDLDWARADDFEEEIPDDVAARSYFPESWKWTIFELKNPKQDSKSSVVTVPLSLDLPSSITTWVVQAVSIKKDQGICVSNGYELTVSKSFFVDLRLPYSVRRNEQVQVRAVVHNYSDSKRKVKVKFSYIENVCSLATKSRGYEQTVEVAEGSTKAVNYVIIPLEAKKIHIEVDAYGSGVRDKVKKDINVLPEGKLVRKRTFSQVVNPKGRSEIVHVKKEALTEVVPNSPTNYFISIQGDIIGESLLGVLDESYLGRLLYIPGGCPEQNMFKTSMNVIATRYLDANKKWDVIGAEKRLKAIDNIVQGHILQLAHHKPDHSFERSTWLTAYVVKMFAMAQGLAHIDKNMLCSSSKWLVSRQLNTGAFLESGQVYAKAMQGGYIGSESETSLTAFVLIALAEVKESCNITEVQNAIIKAKKYLEKKLTSLKEVYSAAITSFALALVGSTENGDYIDQFADPTGTVWEVKGSKLSTLEATGYVLLQKLVHKKYEQAHKIAKWLVSVRNLGGGYLSTQVTVVVLQALTQYKTETNTDTNTNLSVQLLVEGRSQPIEYTIKNQDAYLQRSNKMSADKDLTFNITGSGECTVTVMTVYHSLLTSEKKCNGYFLQAEVKADDRKADTYTLKMTTKYNGTLPATMTLIEITMLTGFTPNIDDLKKLGSDIENYIMSFETKQSTSNASVVLYLKEVPHKETLTIGFRIHKTTDVGLLQPADISIYEYYDLDKQCSTFYNLPKEDGQLRKICKGAQCKCATGACASLIKVTDTDDLQNKACSEGIDFVFRVRLTRTENESGYVNYYVTVLDVIKDESDHKTSKNAELKLISHMACSESVNLETNSEYLIMNHYLDLWEQSPLTSFVLSSKTFMFAWSGDQTLMDFSNNMKVDGCTT